MGKFHDLIYLFKIPLCGVFAGQVVREGSDIEVGSQVGKCIGQDGLTDFLETVLQKTEYQQWFFGHYHDNVDIGQHSMLYEKIVQLQ